MLEAGHDVAVVDNYYNSSPEAIRRVEKITGKTVRLYEADAADKAKMMEILSAEMPDCIIHFAGLKAVGESVAKPTEYYRNNIDTTLTLLECMKELGLTNFVFSSSATVYGEDNVPPFLEDMPKGACTNPYGWTKWMQEQILRDAWFASEKEVIDWAKTHSDSQSDGPRPKELSVVLLRYFNPVGAHESGMIGEDPQGIPNNLMPYISQVAVGRRDHLTVFGDDYDTPDGTCRRDYIHVMDLAEGHAAGSVHVHGLAQGREALPEADVVLVARVVMVVPALEEAVHPGLEAVGSEAVQRTVEGNQADFAVELLAELGRKGGANLGVQRALERPCQHVPPLDPS
jgi:UDP-glucose 4-epimerase